MSSIDFIYCSGNRIWVIDLQFEQFGLFGYILCNFIACITVDEHANVSAYGMYIEKKIYIYTHSHMSILAYSKRELYPFT